MSYNWVCGFLFDAAYRNVALIEKQRPDFQKGLWNGIGGKIEEGDGGNALRAMRREFKEEFGVIPAQAELPWRHFCTLRGGRFPITHEPADWAVHFFFAALHGPLPEKMGLTDERVMGTPIEVMLSSTFPMMPNLHWLIPMAITMGQGQEDAEHFFIQEHYTERIKR